MPASIHIPLWVHLIAVFVGASQGTSLAMTEEGQPLAPTGALVLAGATGLGGAILGDLFLNLLGTRFLVASAVGFGLRMIAMWRGWELGAIRRIRPRG
jgi:uncharacterized membrane protein YeiH